MVSRSAGATGRETAAPRTCRAATSWGIGDLVDDADEGVEVLCGRVAVDLDVVVIPLETAGSPAKPGS